LRVNQNRRQEVSDTLSLLQLLDEEIANAQFLIEQLENQIIARSSWLENWWITWVHFVSNAYNEIKHGLNFSLFKVTGIPITPLIILRVALILLLAYVASRFLSSALLSYGRKRGTITGSSLYNLRRLLSYFVLGIGFLIALFSIGLDFSNLAIGAVALTVGLGFGLQSFANNFLCGMRILFERKLKIGDYIELPSGHTGKVSEIHMQNTVICTSDGIEIVVPNSELTSHTLINWTMNNNYRRLHVRFSTAYGANKELVRKVVSQAVKHVPCAVDVYGEPEVCLEKFDRNALHFVLFVWIDQKIESFTECKEADFLWEIESALHKHSIPIPYPPQVIQMKGNTNHFLEQVELAPSSPQPHH
jgi:potassium efflux system protein